MRRAKKTIEHPLIEALGWYGVIAILLAYTAVTFELTSVHHPLYLLLNLTGSIGILYEAWIKKDWPASALNVVWAAIALIQIIRILF